MPNETIEEKKLISYIKEMRRLGKSDEFIADLLGVNQSTVNRWADKSTRPRENNIDFFVDNFESLFDRKEFIKEVYKREKQRLKIKENDYEGKYNTQDGRDCYKLVKNGMFEDIEEFFQIFNNSADMAKVKFFEKRSDDIFYTGVHGYLTKHGETRAFSFNTNFNKSLNSSTNKLIRAIKRKFTEDYIDFFEITEFWVHGSHYTNGNGNNN